MKPVQLEPQSQRDSLDKYEPTILLLNETFIEAAAEAVKHAKSKIWICAYTWRWYSNAPEKAIQKFNYTVARAAKNGIQVRAIIHNQSQAAYLELYGIQCRKLRTRVTQHTKAVLVDNTHLILGSHNLTEKGTAENYEASLLTHEPEPIYQFENYFDRMWRNFTL